METEMDDDLPATQPVEDRILNGKNNVHIHVNVGVLVKQLLTLEIKTSI